MSEPSLNFLVSCRIHILQVDDPQVLCDQCDAASKATTTTNSASSPAADSLPPSLPTSITPPHTSNPTSSSPSDNLLKVGGSVSVSGDMDAELQARVEELEAQIRQARHNQYHQSARARQHQHQHQQNDVTHPGPGSRHRHQHHQQDDHRPMSGMIRSVTEDSSSLLSSVSMSSETSSSDGGGPYYDPDDDMYDFEYEYDAEGNFVYSDRDEEYFSDLDVDADVTRTENDDGEDVDNQDHDTPTYDNMVMDEMDDLHSADDEGEGAEGNTSSSSHHHHHHPPPRRIRPTIISTSTSPSTNAADTAAAPSTPTTGLGFRAPLLRIPGIGHGTTPDLSLPPSSPIHELKVPEARSIRDLEDPIIPKEDLSVEAPDELNTHLCASSLSPSHTHTHPRTLIDSFLNYLLIECGRSARTHTSSTFTNQYKRSLPRSNMPKPIICQTHIPMHPIHHSSTLYSSLRVISRLDGLMRGATLTLTLMTRR